jgi:hypothetical protein
MLNLLVRGFGGDEIIFANPKEVEDHWFWD